VYYNRNTGVLKIPEQRQQSSSSSSSAAAAAAADSVLQQWSRWTDHGQRSVTTGRSTYKRYDVYRSSSVDHYIRTTTRSPAGLQTIYVQTAWTQDNCRGRSALIHISRIEDCVVLRCANVYGFVTWLNAIALHKNNPSQSYGALPAVWDHTVLFSTRHK